MQLSFSIVGTGNMAWFLAEKLSAAGHHFEGLYGRNLLAAQEIAAQYPTRIYTGTDDIPDKENHICLLAVKDDAIPGIAAQLQFRDTLLAHTAGSVSIAPLADAAVHCAVIWPVYSVTRSRHFLRSGIPLLTQAHDSYSDTLISALAGSIAQQVHAVDETQRFHMHLAAVFANNFTNHMLALAEQLCTEQGLAFSYLQPLIAQTMERAQQESPKALQTGPARRSDETTLNKHMFFLKDRPELAAVYHSLSMSIRKMYENHDQ